ncbi:MAG: type II secretion system protein [Acidobacteriota bacterium]
MRPRILTSRQRGRSQGGFSLIELLIVVAIILVIAAVAVPKMNVQLMSAREMGAIREIGAIHNAETQYYSQFGHFANTLAELGPPSGGAAGPAGADLLPGALTQGKKGGHIFTVSITQNGYAVNVAPDKFGTDGRRTFYSDQTLEIHQNWSQEPATAQSPTLGAAAATEAAK